MIFPKFKTISILFITGLLCFSCVSRKEMVYFQGLEKAGTQLEKTSSNLITIKPNDLLTISVSAPEQDAAIPFNLPVIGVPQSTSSNMSLNVGGQQQLQTYRVNDYGFIHFPVLGRLKVIDLSSSDLSELLESKIQEYVKDPIVNTRIVNFQISVLGEVGRPGTFDIQDEYVSLPKALGLAGDLSVYGRRDNVLVMREKDGLKIHTYLDLTDPSVINSPFYNLQQNDVVYVEPNNAQIQSASYNRNASVYISIASVLVSLAVLLTR